MYDNSEDDSSKDDANDAVARRLTLGATAVERDDDDIEGVVRRITEADTRGWVVLRNVDYEMSIETVVGLTAGETKLLLNIFCTILQQCKAGAYF